MACCYLVHIPVACIAFPCVLPCLLHPTVSAFFSSAHCYTAGLLVLSLLVRPETVPGLRTVITEKRQQREVGCTQGTLVPQPQRRPLQGEVRWSLICLFHNLSLRGVADGRPVGEETVRTAALPGPVAA